MAEAEELKPKGQRFWYARIKATKQLKDQLGLKLAYNTVTEILHSLGYSYKD